MSDKKTTFHRDGSGGITRVTTQCFKDGTSKTTVSKGTQGVFGGFSGRIVSETRADKYGNSTTKKR